MRRSLHCFAFAFCLLLSLLPGEGHALLCSGPLPTSPPAGDPCADAEQQQLNFGRVFAPSFGTAQIKLNRNGTINTGQTTVTTAGGSTTSARTTLRGTSGSQITINFVGTAASGFTLKDFDANYQNGGNFLDDGNPSSVFGPYSARPAGRRLEYGATLVIDSSVAPGVHYIPYEIRVLYHNCTGCTTAPVTRVAVVEVKHPLYVTSGQDMDFKSVMKPTSTTSRIVITPEGAMTVTSGNAILLDGSQGVPGSFLVQGEPGEKISVEADFSSAPPGLVLDAFRGKYNGMETAISSPSLFTLVSGTQELKIGARLTITRNTVTAGHHLMMYDVTIMYD